MKKKRFLVEQIASGLIGFLPMPAPPLTMQAFRAGRPRDAEAPAAPQLWDFGLLDYLRAGRAPIIWSEGRG